MIPPYPLAWPEGTPRSAKHVTSRFKTSLTKAMGNVADSLRRFGDDVGLPIKDVAITSNAALGQMRPEDTGVAVWFLWEEKMRCIAVDRYPMIEDNLQAIHLVLEARRTEARHAGIEMVRTTFKGFIAALPSPNDPTAGAHWTTTLGLKNDATADDVNRAWRGRVKSARQEGNEGLVARINVARDHALADAKAMA